MSFPPRSLLARILSLHVLALAATALAAPLASYLLLSRTTAGYQHHVLRDHAERIAGALSVAGDGRWRLDLPPELRALYAEHYGGFSFAVIDDGGQALFSASPEPSTPTAAPRRPDREVYFEHRQGQADYYGVSLPKASAGRRAWIVVVQDLRHPDVVFDDVVTSFLPRVIALTAPLLLLLLAVDVLIIRRALRPVRQASDMARAIAPDRIDVRLPTRDLPTDIAPLAEAVNQALDRLEAGFRIQRDFTADAAHELRTPLAILRMRIDALADQQAAAPLRADVDSMAQVVGQLLEIAELEQVSIGPDERADLHAVATEVAAQIAPLALSRGKSVALIGAGRPVWVHGRASALYEALRNLVENATLHTGNGKTIEIEVDAEGLVRVVDDGPGISPQDTPHLFQRFWRADRRKSGSAGLGLAIVARIATAHNASVTADNRPGGGAVFTFRLSPTEPPSSDIDPDMDSRGSGVA